MTVPGVGRIALVSFHFHNVTAAGQSTTKVARALADAGYHVTVFTSDENWLEEDRTVDDAGPLADLVVHRVRRDLDTLPRWWRALRRWEARGPILGRVASLPNLLHGEGAKDRSWVIPTVERVLAAAEDEGPFDVLVTRLNHPSSHSVGLELDRRGARPPWVAYFSDPWPFHHYPHPYSSNLGPVSRWRLDRKLDSILERAEVIVHPSYHLRDRELSGPRAQVLDRSFVAPHLGDVFDRAAGRPRSDRLRLRHSGYLMKERRIEPLLEALLLLLAERPELRDVLRVEFVGRYDGEPPSPPAGLEDVVAFDRFVRPEEAHRWLQEADALLLVEADLEVGVFFPSKLSEYLASHRPIVALSPERGVAADLLGPTLLAPPGDATAIARVLGVLATAWQEDRLDVFRPTPRQAAVVAPENVVPIWERAFARALEVAGERRR